jgi:O-glycosyl hydrolase
MSGQQHQQPHRRRPPAVAITTAAAAILLTTITGTTATGSPATSTAVISAAAQQTMNGFGASGGWWTIDFAHFPKQVQDQVAQLLFGDKGIGMTAYRWNIGGGGVGVTVPTGGESELGPANRAPETFYQGPGSYDWSKDPGGTTFLKYAAKYHVPNIVGFAVSAPSAFTTNDQSCGGSLKPGSEQAYADYLATVVQHAKQTWHADVNYVSPMNEPDYTRSDCTQEGMAVPPAQRATVVKAVHDALGAKAPGTQVIADESSRVDSQFLPEVPQWMSDPTAADDTAALAHHTYDFPSDSTLQQAAQLGQRYDKPLWATEICCSVFANGSAQWGQGYDPGITGGLALADIVAQDLTQANDSAFHWWVALSAALGCDPDTDSQCPNKSNANGWNDGLIYYDPQYGNQHNYQIYPTKRLWTLGNFSKFIPNGSVRHAVTGTPPGVTALAFRTAKGWAVVVINNNPTATANLTVRFPAGTHPHPTVAYRTDAHSNLARVTNSTNAPGYSITTYLYDDGGRP